VLHDATTALVKAHPELNLVQEEQFPFLSDISYLRIEEGLDLSVLKANMPVWQEADAPLRPGSYTLPLEAIRELDLPFINFGPYGRGAHQRGERVLMSYSFGVLPQLVCELIENVVSCLEAENRRL
jgi:arginine utilization protein RocB